MDVEPEYDHDFPTLQPKERAAEEGADRESNGANASRMAPPRAATPQDQEDRGLEPERRLTATPRYANAMHMERVRGLDGVAGPAFLWP